MTHTIQHDLCVALGHEMARVDNLRVRIDMNVPSNVFIEFWLRRAVLRAKFALQQQNMAEARRMYNVLVQIGHASE